MNKELTPHSLSVSITHTHIQCVHAILMVGCLHCSGGSPALLSLSKASTVIIAIC